MADGCTAQMQIQPRSNAIASKLGRGLDGGL